MPCLVPVTHKSEALLHTKSEGQIFTFGSNAYSVKEEVTSVPADLHGLVSALTNTLNHTPRLCTGLSGIWCPTASEM